MTLQELKKASNIKTYTLADVKYKGMLKTIINDYVNDHNTTDFVGEDAEISVIAEKYIDYYKVHSPDSNKECIAAAKTCLIDYASFEDTVKYITENLHFRSKDEFISDVKNNSFMRLVKSTTFKQAFDFVEMGITVWFKLKHLKLVNHF